MSLHHRLSLATHYPEVRSILCSVVRSQSDVNDALWENG
jgi:hypothetical protein